MAVKNRALTLATRGLLSGAAITLATNGLVQLPTGTPVEPPVTVPVERVAAGSAPRFIEYGIPYKHRSIASFILSSDTIATYSRQSTNDYRHASFGHISIEGSAGKYTNAQYQHQSEFRFSIGTDTLSRTLETNRVTVEPAFSITSAMGAEFRSASYIKAQTNARFMLKGTAAAVKQTITPQAIEHTGHLPISILGEADYAFTKQNKHITNTELYIDGDAIVEYWPVTPDDDEQLVMAFIKALIEIEEG